MRRSLRRILAVAALGVLALPAVARASGDWQCDNSPDGAGWVCVGQIPEPPAKVRVPAYHPDTPEVRQDWAQYYDRLTEMDALAGENLREIEEAGLAEDTIVFYYGDHGSGMPRNSSRAVC